MQKSSQYLYRNKIYDEQCSLVYAVDENGNKRPRSKTGLRMSSREVAKYSCHCSWLHVPSCRHAVDESLQQQPCVWLRWIWGMQTVRCLEADVHSLQRCGHVTRVDMRHADSEMPWSRCPQPSEVWTCDSGVWLGWIWGMQTVKFLEADVHSLQRCGRLPRHVVDDNICRWWSSQVAEDDNKWLHSQTEPEQFVSTTWQFLLHLTGSL